jgi:tetratricopeptide (TPR) repeat protein
MKSPCSVILPFILAAAATAAPRGFVGSSKCAQCHADIARTQATTRMAHTWHGSTTSALPPGYVGRAVEGKTSYTLEQAANTISFAAKSPSLGSVTAPVEAIVGGPRHGLSFLARIEQIAGEALARPALFETRFLYSTPHRQLELSPGFSKEPPASWETALGRVLAPEFEKRCLTCHGAPLAPGLQGTGVQCESCHGPGGEHLASVAQGTPGGIMNPARLSNEQRVEQCAACHADARPLADPQPDDLLISHQVEAIRHSECYIQTGAGLNCSTCHNPHKDETDTVARSEKACKSCHTSGMTPHASVCPVNAATGCVACHMRTTQKDTFRMVDHWIRAFPGTGKPASRTPVRSQIAPKRAFLRILAVGDREKADDLRKQLLAGASFFDLARQHSTGPSPLAGGYLGDVEIAKLDGDIRNAAGQLAYGELSPVTEAAGNWILIERLPRDFRWRANQLFEEGQALKAKGLLRETAAKYQSALQVYPHFLRALVFFGSTVGEEGDLQRAIAILEHALKLYPEDAGALYNLGIAYGAAGRTGDETRTYEQAIGIDPDLTPAYLNLGASLFSAAKLDKAAEMFERGLQTNPLSARLYYNLALVREQQGRADEARRLMRLVQAIDPQFTRTQQPPRKSNQH